MATAYIRADYLGVKKPFIIEGRQGHCGGVDKWTIARIDEQDARLLIESGMEWGGGEPDWSEHHRRIELMQAEADKADAERRITELSE